MSAEYRAVVSASPTHPARILSALGPEQGAVPGDAEASLETRDGTVRIEVTAPDIGSLRASVAGWTALLDVATDATDRTGS